MAFESGGGNSFFSGLTADVKTTFVEAEGRYYGSGDPTQTSLYVIDLSDNDTSVAAERNHLSLLFCSDPTLEGNPALPAGTYRVGTTRTAGTLLYGTITPDGYDIAGSYCEHGVLGSSYVDDRDFYGLVAGGTVEVVCSGTQYTLTAKLRDTDGFAIEGSYMGPLEFYSESHPFLLETDLQPLQGERLCTWR